jgi:hypothetical protein
MPGRRRPKKARTQTSALIILALSFRHSRVRGGGGEEKEAFMMRRRVILELERADIKGTCTTHYTHISGQTNCIRSCLLSRKMKCHEQFNIYCYVLRQA